MNNYPLNAQEQKKVEKIRTQYIPKEENEVLQLKKLDKKVKLPGQIIAYIIGTIGALIMGAGMSMIMLNSVTAQGVALGIIGMGIAISAYPIYTLIIKSRKKKYASDVLRMSAKFIED